jgi:hypothetical protein
VEATANADPTLEKIVLMLDATPGMTAPAATATKPAINAYSIRSCPCVSLNTFSFKNKFFITFSPLIVFDTFLPVIDNISHIVLRTSGLRVIYWLKDPTWK